MQKTNCFLLITIISVLPFLGTSQSIWLLPDPEGNPVEFTPDSIFAYKDKFTEKLVLYAIDQDSLRNVLVTDCKESRWLFEMGKPLGADYTKFLWVGTNQVFFAIDSVWYLANDDFSEVEVYNDNRDPSYEYIFLAVDEIYFDTWITALERATGDRVLLFYNSGTRTFYRYQDENTNDIRVYKWLYLDKGQDLNNIYFVGSIYDTSNGIWTLPGLYFIKDPNNPKLLLELGERAEYNIDAFQWFGTYVIDYVEGNQAKVYDYDPILETLEDVTNVILDGDEVVYVKHLKNPYGDEDQVNYSPFETLWKIKEGNTIKYILRDGLGFMPGWQLVDINGVEDVDAMISSAFEDSVYYYNYDDTFHGLVRLNFRNGITVKDATGIAFNSEFKLFGWEGKMYYAKYDPINDKIFACYQDFLNNYENGYIESTIGQRIENPVNFYPFEEYMVIESEAEASNYLFVYHPTKTVAVSEIPATNTVEVFPNPSDGKFYVTSSDEDQSIHSLELYIYDSAGNLAHTDRIVDLKCPLEMDDIAEGIYFLILCKNGEVVGHEKLEIIK